MWNESIIFEIDFNIYEIKNNEMIEYSILSKWKHYHIWTFIYCDNKDKKKLFCFVIFINLINHISEGVSQHHLLHKGVFQQHKTNDWKDKKIKERK